MEDTFVLAPSNKDTPSLLALVNLIDSCIQFTANVENKGFFLFFMCWFLNIKTSSQHLFSENYFEFLFHPMLSPIIFLKRKWLLSMLTFFVLYTFALTRLIFLVNVITYNLFLILGSTFLL